MKDVSEQTRLSPAARELQIRKFSENVASKGALINDVTKIWRFLTPSPLSIALLWPKTCTFDKNTPLFA